MYKLYRRMTLITKSYCKSQTGGKLIQILEKLLGKNRLNICNQRLYVQIGK